MICLGSEQNRRRLFDSGEEVLGGDLCFLSTDLPLNKHKTCLNFLGNMGYMSVKDENFPRAQGVSTVSRGKQKMLAVFSLYRPPGFERQHPASQEVITFYFYFGLIHGWGYGYGSNYTTRIWTAGCSPC